MALVLPVDGISAHAEFRCLGFDEQLSKAVATVTSTESPTRPPLGFFVGTQGSGKTTALRALARALPTTHKAFPLTFNALTPVLDDELAHWDADRSIAARLVFALSVLRSNSRELFSTFHRRARPTLEQALDLASLAVGVQANDTLVLLVDELAKLRKRDNQEEKMRHTLCTLMDQSNRSIRVVFTSLGNAMIENERSRSQRSVKGIVLPQLERASFHALAGDALVAQGLGDYESVLAQFCGGVPRVMQYLVWQLGQPYDDRSDQMERVRLLMDRVSESYLDQYRAREVPRAVLRAVLKGEVVWAARKGCPGKTWDMLAEEGLVIRKPSSGPHASLQFIPFLPEVALSWLVDPEDDNVGECLRHLVSCRVPFGSIPFEDFHVHWEELRSRLHAGLPATQSLESLFPGHFKRRDLAGLQVRYGPLTRRTGVSQAELFRIRDLEIAVPASSNQKGLDAVVRLPRPGARTSVFIALQLKFSAGNSTFLSTFSSEVVKTAYSNVRDLFQAQAPSHQLVLVFAAYYRGSDPIATLAGCDETENVVVLFRDQLDSLYGPLLRQFVQAGLHQRAERGGGAEGEAE